MASISNESRRSFLKIASTTGGGLLLGCNWSDTQAATSIAVTGSGSGAISTVDFNSFLSISPAGIITILYLNSEVG